MRSRHNVLSSAAQEVTPGLSNSSVSFQPWAFDVAAKSAKDELSIRANKELPASQFSDCGNNGLLQLTFYGD